MIQVRSAATSRLRVFTSAHTACLGRRVGPEREPSVVASEKYAARRGSVEDERRMSTACFARALQRCTSRTYMHFLPTFQEVIQSEKSQPVII
jgi:hypothetical protein